MYLGLGSVVGLVLQVRCASNLIHALHAKQRVRPVADRFGIDTGTAGSQIWPFFPKARTLLSLWCSIELVLANVNVVAALLGSLEVDLSIARGAGARRVRACLPPHLCCAHPADVSNCVGDLLGACFDKMSGYPVSDLRERCIPRHVFGGAAAVCARCLPLVASPVGFGGLGWRFGH